MSKKLITTINNEELPISHCRKYDKKYYKIGDINIENSGDCYKIDDKFYRIETGQIVFNHTENKYCIKNNNLLFGLIKGNEKGYFTNNINKIKIIDETGSWIWAINEEILQNNFSYRERISTGEYIHISQATAKELNQIKVPNKDYKFSLPYDSKGITDKHLEIYNNLYDSKISPSIDDFSKLLGDLTFGLEFETIAGFLPPRITNKLGLIPLRDGSIQGLEYVTVPFKGAKGLQTVVDISNELNKRTAFDYKCSLHLHLGGIPRTPEFILAFFRTTLFIQDELFSLFPIYKKYNLGIKNKNYSKPYPVYKLVSKMNPVINDGNVKANFGVLFDYLVGEQGSFYHNYNLNLNNVKSHPKDPSGNQKWNISTRYYFHNFIPLIFGNKQTVEFRIHTPTYDVDKIFLFIGLNAILINFTKKFEKEILSNERFFDIFPKGLEDVIKKYLTSLDSAGAFRKNKSLSLSTMFDSFRYYISKRKQKIEILTGNGNIVIDESDLNNYRSPINWSEPRTENSDFICKDGVQLSIDENEVFNVPNETIKKKPSKVMGDGFLSQISKENTWTTGYETFDYVLPSSSSTSEKRSKRVKTWMDLQENETMKSNFEKASELNSQLFNLKMDELKSSISNDQGEF